MRMDGGQNDANLTIPYHLYRATLRKFYVNKIMNILGLQYGINLIASLPWLQKNNTPSNQSLVSD